MVARDDEEQHCDKIGAPAIQDHKQGGGAEGNVQALLDMDDDTISEKISYYLDQLEIDPPDNCDFLPLSPYDPQQLTEVYEQLALYRIRAYHVISYHHLNRVKIVQFCFLSHICMLHKYHVGWPHLLFFAPQALLCV